MHEGGDFADTGKLVGKRRSSTVALTGIIIVTEECYHHAIWKLKSDTTS
jgi:hypothetical protein